MDKNKVLIQKYTLEAIELLKQLIATRSFSGQEHGTAELIHQWLTSRGVTANRQGNNVWATNLHVDPAKPTLLLNSHHDTVQPNQGYTRDPYLPEVVDGRLYGLGSNDAGGALVSLMAVFMAFYHEVDLTHNLVLAATAEEENSGPNGLVGLLNTLPHIDVAIVGEPTQMQLAIAEKGLVVFDGIVEGTASHAAHPNEDNPIYGAIPVLEWFKNYRFDRVSPQLGPVKITVTQIQAGVQHNAVPAQLHLVVDVRVNECYTNAEIAAQLQADAPCTLTPRSLRLNSSGIAPQHPLVLSGLALGRTTYGSPTLSDQAVLSCPSLKMGPGDSTRSHSADEFIYLDELMEAPEIYVQLLTPFLKPQDHETLG